MSLNKITNSSDYLQKQYLNIGCNDIKCSSLEINGSPVETKSPVDAGDYNPTLSANDCTVGAYQASYRYSKNLMTLYINADFTITAATTAIVTLQASLPIGYTILVNNQEYPSTGLMSNYTTVPFTTQAGFTSIPSNNVSCDYRTNGVNMTTGQTGKITFVGTFLVNPPS